MSTLNESKVMIMMMKSGVKVMRETMAFGLWSASHSSVGVEMGCTVTCPQLMAVHKLLREPGEEETRVYVFINDYFL